VKKGFLQPFLDMKFANRTHLRPPSASNLLGDPFNTGKHVMKTIQLLLGCIAAAGALVSCADTYNYRTGDSVALVRANFESIHGPNEENSDLRTHSTRASADLKGLQGATGLR
jgi:hypothetical protein